MNNDDTKAITALRDRIGGGLRQAALGSSDPAFREFIFAAVLNEPDPAKPKKRRLVLRKRKSPRT